jgi:hypothetical protein
MESFLSTDAPSTVVNPGPDGGDDVEDVATVLPATEFNDLLQSFGIGQNGE